MNNLILLVVAAGILVYGLVSGQAKKSIITAPMAFVLFGFIIGPTVLHVAPFNVEHGFIHVMAEITLLLVLFTDAARIDIRLLRREHNLPERLLIIGMPLTIILGTIVAYYLLRMSLWDAAILAAILAPTDAALGQAVVNSELIPPRIRQALNVESGLNDGIALPIILIFVSFAGVTEHSQSFAFWTKFTLLQVILGPIVGCVIGFFGGRLVEYASDTGWMTRIFQDLAALGLSIIAYALAVQLGGNGFIAAFCAGLMLGNFSRKLCQCLYEFAEAEGQLLTLLIFMIFGAVLMPTVIEYLTWQTFLYALLSLTVIRMIPVCISLFGANLCWDTQLFLGWFGPRGIASILFGLLVLEEAQLPGTNHILSVVFITVTLSIFAHGITAYPATRWYGRRLARRKRQHEHATVTEMPVRLPDASHKIAR